MDGLARIFLKVGACYPNRERLSLVGLYADDPFSDDRLLELADLVALGEVWVEVVFAIKGAG